MKRIVIASLALVLTAPSAASAGETPRPLRLSLADANRDGVVSEDEAAAVLVRASSVADFQMVRPRAAAPEPEPFVPEPGPLDLERRIVPATAFEYANEQAFRIEKRKRN